MKSRPLVSVSMITYNHEKYIRMAVESILNQDTTFEYELVLSNDNSPDSTNCIIQSILNEHPRSHLIHYFLHKSNLGMVKNSLHNIENCRGEYIAFCEGDDAWIDRDKLEIQVSEMKKHPRCDISFHPAVVFSGLNRTNSIIAMEYFKNKIFAAATVIQGGGEFCPTASLLIRRKVLATMPPCFQEGPVGDYFMQIAGSLRGGALYIHKPMSLYRIHTECSWTSTMNVLSRKQKFFRDYAKSISKFDAFLKKRYSKQIHTETRKHYKDISLLLLIQKNFPEHRRLYIENIENHKNTFEIIVLYYLGRITRSAGVVNLVNRLFFIHPNVFIRAFKKALSLHFRIKNRFSTSGLNSNPKAGSCEVWLKN